MKQRGQKADGKGSRKKLFRMKSNQGKSTASLRSFDLNGTEQENIFHPFSLPHFRIEQLRGREYTYFPQLEQQ